MRLLYLDGSIDEEIDFNFRDLFPEKCGLSGAINLETASRYVYDLLVLQQPRGERSVGEISHNGKFHQRRRMGSVRKQLQDVVFEDELPGDMAIGHNRYATQGDPDSITNIQPFLVVTKHGQWSIGQNGTLVTPDKFMQEYLSQGAVFQSTTDTEILVHAIANSAEANFRKALIEALHKIPSAYSLMIMTDNEIYAIKDKFGLRPLSMARLRGGRLFCSENYAVDQYPDIEDIEDINPGEMVIARRGSDDVERITYTDPSEAVCVFEMIYFSNPRSRYKGVYHEDYRFESGRRIVQENPHMRQVMSESGLEWIVVPTLDSGKHAARGVAEELGLKYVEAFQRVHNPPQGPGRSFTAPTEILRERAAYQKLHLRDDLVRGYGVWNVDDSIVRATTSRIRNERLRKAGAKATGDIIGSAPISNICPSGMDYQTLEQLAIVKFGSEEGIREHIHTDHLVYFSRAGQRQLAKDMYDVDICDGCFGGDYARVA